MYYSNDIIDEVRSRNDIVDVVSSYVKIQKKGANYMGLCPFHAEKSPSFSVSPGKQLFHCFGCGVGGDVITFIRQYENYSFNEALALLAKRANIELPQINDNDRAKSDEKNIILEINKTAARYFYENLFSKEGEVGLKYFKDRGLDSKDITHFGLGFAKKTPNDLYHFLKDSGYSDDILKKSGLINIDEKGVRDRFWNRVMFPIIDANSRVIGFGGRVLGDGLPKYVNSPETLAFDKSRNLYGLNFAKRTRRDFFLICEGYMDVIALHNAGFENSVASLGTALTALHVKLIGRYTKKVILTYDSDKAGINAAKRAIPLLKEENINVKVLSMAPYKDPDEFIKNLGSEEFQKRIDNADNAFLWEIEVLKKDYNLNEPDERTSFYKEVARMLSLFSEKLERENYTHAVAKRLMIEYNALFDMVNSFGNTAVFSKKDMSRENKKTDDGYTKAQGLLLTWMVEETELFDRISEYISPENFTEGFYRDVATKIFEKLKTGDMTFSNICDDYTEDMEKQKLLSKILNTTLGTNLSDDEKKKAITESILKIRQASLDEKSKNAKGIEEFQKIIEEQAILRKLRVDLG
ncbi:MAG: DNA primase [Lachnospiraceae bacterium]|nr:MAG: DNA primase [Lachnospiraceae bacterium]